MGASPFEANEDNILENALYVYDYINKVVGIEQENIIIFGRSIGSGPAIHVSSLRKPGALLLMSAFTSIRDIIKDQMGNYLQYLVRDRFNNLEKMGKVRSPTFIVHGLKDNLISYHHSLKLHEKCNAPCSIIMPMHMDHNDFNFV